MNDPAGQDRPREVRDPDSNAAPTDADPNDAAVNDAGSVPDAMWGQGLAVLDQHLAAHTLVTPTPERAVVPAWVSPPDPVAEQHLPPADAASATGEGDRTGEPGESQESGRPGGGGQAAEPFCPSVEVWVEQVLAPTYARRATSQFRWCAQWWRHPEAVSRLEALWRSWEALRRDPLLGMSGWLRDHLDAQLPVLCGPAGPFAECDPTRHFDPAQPCLPLQAVPLGWWADTPTP